MAALIEHCITDFQSAKNVIRILLDQDPNLKEIYVQPSVYWTIHAQIPVMARVQPYQGGIHMVMLLGVRIIPRGESTPGSAPP